MNAIRHAIENFFAQVKRPAPRKNRRNALAIEALEPRQLLTANVTNQGGAVLQHVEVQALYYGKDWSTNAALYNQTGSVENYVNYMVHSSYMDMLQNAGYGVGRGSFTQGRIVNVTPNKSQWLTDQKIQNDLASEIYWDRSIAQPDANRLYIVFVEPGVGVMQSNGSTSQKNTTAHPGFSGYHGSFGAYDNSGHWHASVAYAVIPYPGNGNFGPSGIGGAAQFNYMTEVTSHELAEAVTDPALHTWYDKKTGNEIGDIVAWQECKLNGYVVQKEAGKQGQALMPYGATAYRDVYGAATSTGNGFSAPGIEYDFPGGQFGAVTSGSQIPAFQTALLQGALARDGHNSQTLVNETVSQTSSNHKPLVSTFVMTTTAADHAFVDAAFAHGALAGFGTL